MLRWIANVLSSSIGKKAVMAATGLLLFLFLVEHLYGNLKLVPPLGASDGSDFEAYRDELHSWGWLLRVAEVGLFALFALHAFLGFRLTLENREARKQRYVLRNDRGAKTLASATMFVTGALILGYLIKHVLDFRFDGTYQEAPAATVAAKLSHPGHGLVYLAVAIVIGMHLSHGFRSAFHSLGASHPRWNPLLVGLGWTVSIVFAAGFAAIPLYYLLFWSAEGAA